MSPVSERESPTVSLRRSRGLASGTRPEPTDRSGVHARDRRSVRPAGRSNRAIADDMHLAVSKVAKVIRPLRRKADAKVVVVFRAALIPYLSRMTSNIEG